MRTRISATNWIPRTSDPKPASQVNSDLVLSVDEALISVHTSGEPDPAFHSLANDARVQVLVFKLSAATGFDAPRAWTLVSLRPSISPEFGLQVVGRIMRVHPEVRPHHGQDTLLDRGYVFLADRARQLGLDAAADQLKSLRSAIELVSDQLRLLEVTTGGAGGGTASGVDATISIAAGPPIGYPLGQGASSGVAAELIVEHVGQLAAEMSLEPTLPGILSGERMLAPPLNGPRLGYAAYHLRRDLGIPLRLQRERMPNAAQLPQLAQKAAAEFLIDDAVVGLLMRPGIEVELRLRELLLAEQERSEHFAARPSAAKLAEAAQLVFSFNDDIDPRLFRRALVDRFRTAIEDKGGICPPEAELRRSIDHIAVYQPDRVREAMRRAMSRYVQAVQADPMPAVIEDVDGLFEATRAAYGMFPSRMNGPERAFAEFVDELPGVRWWLRNPDHPSCTWSVRVVTSEGRGFYPDFVIGVAGRRTPDEVRLAEIKDTGETGRLHADINVVKIRTRHRAYLDVLWVSEDDDAPGRFSKLEFSTQQNRIVAVGPLRPDDLRGD